MKRIVAVLVALSIGVAHGTTYHMKSDGNDGSNGTTKALAWLTFSTAVGSGGINAGDTLLVHAGS